MLSIQNPLSQYVFPQNNSENITVISEIKVIVGIINKLISRFFIAIVYEAIIVVTKQTTNIISCNTYVLMKTFINSVILFKLTLKELSPLFFATSINPGEVM